MASGVYAIVNTVNGKRYVGSSRDIAIRWRGHKADLKRGAHHSRILQSAWNKYGRDAFMIITLEEVEVDRLLLVEQEYLDREIGEYNASSDAANPPSWKGRKQSTVHISRRTVGMTGRKFSPETIQKMRDAQQRRANEGRMPSGAKQSDAVRRGWAHASPEARRARTLPMLRAIGRSHCGDNI